MIRFWMFGRLQYCFIRNRCCTFDILYFLLNLAVKNIYFNVTIGAMPWMPNMQQVELLTFHWQSFLGCGREHATVGFASKGGLNMVNRRLQPSGIWITNDAKLIIVDALWKPILRMLLGACHYCFWKSRQPISDNRMSLTNNNIHFPTCTAKNHSHSINPHSKNGEVTGVYGSQWVQITGPVVGQVLTRNCTSAMGHTTSYPVSCNWAGFTTNNWAFQPHKFGSKYVSLFWSYCDIISM